MLKSFNGAYGEEADRMMPKIAGDKAQPQGPMRVAVVAERAPRGAAVPRVGGPTPHGPPPVRPA